MKGILLKDLYLGFKSCKLYFLVIIAFVAVALFNKGTSMGSYTFLIYPMLFAGMIPYNLLAFDERDGWNKYEQTLPVSKSQIVASKYILGFVTNTALVLFILIAKTIIFGYDSSFFTVMAVGYFISLAFPSITMLLIFRFGFTAGRIVGIVVAAVIGVVTALAVNTLNVADINMHFNSNTSFCIICIISAIVIYSLSFLLSRRIYNKREF